MFRSTTVMVALTRLIQKNWHHQVYPSFLPPILETSVTLPTFLSVSSSFFGTGLRVDKGKQSVFQFMFRLLRLHTCIPSLLRTTRRILKVLKYKVRSQVVALLFGRSSSVGMLSTTKLTPCGLRRKKRRKELCFPHSDRFHILYMRIA